MSVYSRIEDGIQRGLVKLLDLDLAPGWRYFAIPNGEFRPGHTGAILKGLGVKAGVFDLCFLAGGRTFFLELKAPGRGLTPEQEAFQAFLCKAAIENAVASSVEEAIAILARWGALRRKVTVQ